MAWGDLTTGQKVAGSALAGGGLASGIANLFGGGGRNPAGGAMKYLDQIPGAIEPYYKPYVEAGASALPGYEDIMSKLLSNPAEFMNTLGQGYQQSPGFDWAKKQGEGAITNAQAAGGMLGTPQHQQEAGELATNLANQDFDKYMQRVLQGLGVGAGGMSDIVGKGYGASSSLADKLAEILGTKAQYKYAGQAGENQKKSSGWGDIFSGIGSLAGMFL